ncbi:hypothetical protein A3Q56_07548, partial [Intoshia linei]
MLPPILGVLYYTVEDYCFYNCKHGKCKTVASGNVCECEKDFYGSNCDKTCHNLCLNNSNCIIVNNLPYCDCHYLYTGDICQHGPCLIIENGTSHAISKKIKNVIVIQCNAGYILSNNYVHDLVKCSNETVNYQPTFRITCHSIKKKCPQFLNQFPTLEKANIKNIFERNLVLNCPNNEYFKNGLSTVLIECPTYGNINFYRHQCA